MQPIPIRIQLRNSQQQGVLAEDAALKGLREVAACADNFVSTLTPSIRRLLLGLRDTLICNSQDRVHAAWQSALRERALRIRLCQALGTTVRRLTQRVQIADAGERRTRGMRERGTGKDWGTKRGCQLLDRYVRSKPTPQCPSL